MTKHATSLVVLVAALAAAPFANAAGCAKGAAVGGVAGHVAGHHGLLGAAAGCIVGKHRAHKHEQLAKQQAAQAHSASR